MTRFILKKLGILIITVLAVSFLTFLAFSVVSGDVATSMLGTQATPEKVEALREQLGLNVPVLLRYKNWLFSFVRGDFGISYGYGIPVTELLAGKLKITLVLTFISFAFIIILALPLGIASAMHMDKFTDKFLRVLGQLVMAIPPFFLGMLFTIIFGLTLKWFVPGGYVSYTESVSGFIGYLIFPALSVALPRAAMCGRFLRSSLLAERHKDYTLTAYSRGNNSRGVFYRHMLKNALIPVITFLAVVIPEIVAGSIIVEQVFSVPGLGRILITSISNRDFPVVLAIVVFITILVTGLNFIADILYHKLDARIDVR